MQHTFVSHVKAELESAGYFFQKDVDNYWNMVDNSAQDNKACVIESNRSLGCLLRSLAKQFNIE